MALPLAYPEAPIALWRGLFWGGTGVTAISALALFYDLAVRPRLARHVDHSTASLPPIPPPPIQRYEWGTLDASIVEPRMSEIAMRQLTTAAEVYDLASGQETIVLHFLAGLDDTTRAVVESLCSTLRTVMGPKSEKMEPPAPWEANDIRAVVADHMVQLRGKDILIYGDTHFKWLPERDSAPFTPDPMIAEFQLILAFRRREEYRDNLSVTVTVDNGQPRVRRKGLIPKKD
jgi:hypothetical protein